LPALSGELQLAGFVPNPALGASRLGFSLPSNDPATLEVYSVDGRRVLTREVGSLGAGSHFVELSPGLVRPGVYWIRVTQQGRSLTKRGVILE
jgi:hypothetical protein